VEDSPGVLAAIASILGKTQISISSVLQHEPAGDVETEGIPVVITTHLAAEGGLRKALAEVNRLEAVKAPCVCIRMVEEHPERVE
jgi:homoserine dehydrogenase